MIAWLTQYFEQFQYIAIALVLFLAGLGVPIPEDIPLIYGGVLSGQGHMNVYIHFAVSMTFILVGDLSLYLIGRRLAAKRLQKNAQSALTPTDDALDALTPTRWERLASPERLAKVQGYFNKYGSWSVFLGRFVAGVRGAVFLTAGMGGFPLWRFLLLDGLAALISVPLWIALGYWAGARWELLLEQAKTYQLYLLGALTLALIIGAYLARRRSLRDITHGEPPFSE